MQLRWYWAHYAASAPYRVLVEASIRAAGWLRDGRSGDRRALNDRWHRRCTPAGAFGGAARQWRTGHHVALPHPPDSGRGLRLMWPFRKSAETRSSSGGFTMPRPADIIRHLPGRTPIMGADAAWEVAMISRIWDEDATIVVAKRCLWRSRSASGGWAIRRRKDGIQGRLAGSTCKVRRSGRGQPGASQGKPCRRCSRRRSNRHDRTASGPIAPAAADRCRVRGDAT